jgi:hypothetical protein
MHLHANAVLTVRQRQRLCDLVAAGVTISGAAVVVGCCRQTASKWVNRGRRGESLLDRSSRPWFSPRLTPAAVEEAILGAREQLQEGPHVIGWGLGRCLHGACGPAPPRPLPPDDPAAAGRGDPLRARLPGRPDPCRHQEAGPDPETGPPRHRRPQRPAEREGRLAVPVRRCRRLLPARPRRRPRRRNKRQRDRVPGRARPLLRQPPDQREARLDRQRQLLQTTLGHRLRRPRHHRQENAALPATDKRKNGTVHPHDARALGLRLRVRQRNRTTTGPRTRTRLLQSLPSPTAPSTATHRSNASTTSLGQTTRGAFAVPPPGPCS